MRVAFALIFLSILSLKFLIFMLIFPYLISLVLSLISMVILLGIIFYFGDKWIIGQLRAHNGDIPQYIVRLGENLKYKMHVGNVHFYISSEYSKNIYFFQTMNNKPILVMGRDIFKALTQEEMEALLFLFFHLVDKNHIRKHTWFNLLLLFYVWPLLLLKHWGFSENTMLVRCMSFCFFPFNFFRFLIADKSLRKAQNLMSDEIKSQYGFNTDSLIFKINKLHNADIRGRLENSLFLDNFALVPCQHLGVLNQLVFQDLGFSKQYE